MKSKICSTQHDVDYSALLSSVVEHFNTVTRNQANLFATDIDGERLWLCYLNNLDEDIRQQHNCHCCKDFIKRYGSLVIINEDGTITSALWPKNEVLSIYADAFSGLRLVAEQARVTGVFYGKTSVLGNPQTGKWSHLSVTANKFQNMDRLLTAGQHTAAILQSYQDVQRALVDKVGSKENLDQMIRVFEAAALPRSEKFIEPIKWLRKLHDRPKGKLGTNVLWREVAAAPEGFLHPRSSVVWPLLETLQAGGDFDSIKRQFVKMVDPLHYQRPQVAPTAGNIKQAEEIIEKLGIAKSLERRFARLEDLTTKVWSSKVSEAHVEDPGSVFGHLKAKGATQKSLPLDLPAKTMTWGKFVDRVLPTVQKLELYAPNHGNYCALLTTVYADAPNIMKWSNPVSWYVYHSGSLSGDWGVSSVQWTQVTAVVDTPNKWDGSDYLAEGAVLTLKNCVDQRKGQGNALFPENLRSDLHSVRSTIEAYSRSAEIQGREEATACGYMIRRESCSIRLRVDGQVYVVDRWE